MLWNFLIQKPKAILSIIRTTYIFNLQSCKSLISYWCMPEQIKKKKGIERARFTSCKNFDTSSECSEASSPKYLQWLFNANHFPYLLNLSITFSKKIAPKYYMEVWKVVFSTIDQWTDKMTNKEAKGKNKKPQSRSTTPTFLLVCFDVNFTNHISLPIILYHCELK
jgi:hypothetical protein